MELHSGFFNHDAQAGGFYPMAHVSINIADFGERQNVLIEGIRGTGKTHILKMLEKHYMDNFSEYRILPIFVSLAQINEHAKKEPEEFRLHLYTHVVEKCIETVQKYSKSLQPDRSLLDKSIAAISQLFGVKSKGEFESTIEYIRKTADHLKFKLQFDLTNDTFKTFEKEHSSSVTELKGNAQAKFPAGSVGSSLTLKDGQTSEESVEEVVTFLGTRLAHKNASQFLLEFLKQLQVALNLEHSLLLLDECSEANFDSQIEIFRLFKTIRGANTLLADKAFCAFFVGCVYPKGETYYPTRAVDGFVFQPGQDCTIEFLQWDETDIEAYVRFFEEMTLARAKYLLNYSGSFSELSTIVFENREAFLLAAYCANGIPRRYWELLKQSYDKNFLKVTIASLDIAIQEIANNQVVSSSYLNENDISFIDRLIADLNGVNIDIRRKNKIRGRVNPMPQSIYFSVKRGLEQQVSNLVIHGAVHEKSRTRTTRRRSRPEPIYAIDMAVAYTFRVIPPKSFVEVITKDVTRCASCDFNQSPYYKSISRVGPSEALSSAKQQPFIQDQVYSGLVASYYSNKHFGFIDVKGKEKQVFLHVSAIPPEWQKKLKPGAIIEFKAINTIKGWNAIEVKVIQQGTLLSGTVKSFQEGEFGFIEVDDGGPNATFLIETITESESNFLKEGVRVSFYSNNTPKSRRAINIREKVE